LYEAKLELVHLDLVSLQTLDGSCFSDAYPSDLWQSYLDRPQRFYIRGLIEQHKLVGFLCFSVLEPEAELIRVGILPEFRSLGFALKGIRAAQEDLTGRAIERFLLEVRESNMAARKLYHRLGYVNDGRRPRYYPGEPGQPAEDALLMSLDLK